MTPNPDPVPPGRTPANPTSPNPAPRLLAAVGALTAGAGAATIVVLLAEKVLG
jgi:hypothetical protein